MPKALPPAPSKRASGRSQAQRAQIYALHMANAARNAVNFGGTAARATVLQPLAMTDRIIISSLRLNATVGPDRWRKRRAQPTDLSITLTVDLAQAGQADDVNATVNYGTLSKSLTSRLDGAEFESLHALAAEAAAQALAKPGVLEVIVDAEALNQFLLAKSAGERLHRRINDNNGLNPDEAYIYDLRLNVIIGVNPLEREFKQEVVTNIVFIAPTWTQPDWLGMHDNLVKAIETSSYLTLEAFATNVARVACSFDGTDLVTIKAEKPSALVHAGSSGVEITRSQAFFQKT